MTYSNVIRRGWFCKCKPRSSHPAVQDTWMEWRLCGQCRLPIQGSNQRSAEKQKASHK